MPVHSHSSARRILAGAMALTVVHLSATVLLAQSAGSPQPIAGELSASASLDAARQAFVDGKLIQAQGLLRRLVKGETLSAEQRGSAADLLQRTDQRIRSADVVEMSLQKAELAMSEGELVVAERQVLAVLGRGQLPAAQRERASAFLKQIGSAREEFKPMVADALSRASEDFKAGRYGQAKSGFAALTRTGVDLSPEQRALVTQYQMRLVDLETSQNRKFEDAPVAFGLLQPGAVRREGEPAPAAQDQPPAQPASEPAAAQPPAAPAPAPAEPAAQPPAQPVQPVQPSGGNDVIAMALRAEGERFIAEADMAFSEGRYNEAAEKYQRALASARQYLSSDQVRHAESRLSDCRARTGRNAQGASLSQEEIKRQQVIREKTDAEFKNQLAQAEAALKSANTGEARQLTAQARVTVNSAKQYFSQRENEDAIKAIDDLNRRIAAAEEEIRVNTAKTQEAEIKKKASEAERSLRDDKDRRVREAITRARALQQEQKYEEALQIVEQVLFLDPTNPAGLLLRDIIGDIIAYRKQDDIYRTKRSNQQKIQLENEAASIPPVRIMAYPTDWPSKSFNRGELAAYNDSADNRRAMASLERRIPANFEAAPLAAVVEFIRQTTSAQFDVDWDSLRTIGVDHDSPISLSLTDAPASVVLQRVLAKATRAEAGEKASFSVLDGIVTVGSELSLRKNVVAQPYNITDMLLDTPNFTDVPSMDLRTVIASAEGRQGPASPFMSKNKSEPRMDRDGRIRQIVNVIENTVDPDGWRDRGGETSAITELNGSLIITTTPANHREIAGLLGKLREQRSMQINVETRFLTVNQDFFEQIGFDIDVYFNTGSSVVRNAQLNDPSILPGDFFDFRQPFGTDSSGNPVGPIRRDITGQPTTNGTSPPANADTTRVRQGTVAPNSFSPIGIGQGSLGIGEGLASGFSPFAADILSRAPALGVAGQFLDDVQVDFLIKATQADRRSSTLTAPRLTLTNGQVSNVYVATQRSFISDLTPVTGESAVGFDPQPGVLTEGVVMQVEGAISSDRRYVTLNIDTSVSQADRPFRQVGVTAVTGGNLVNSRDTQSFIELPSINTTRVQTTVTVPDEGTVLLGGQRLVTELEVESGVPVLSKIPIINRFFSNRIQSKQEQTLMILVKPTVLIQTEEEERNFPGLSDTMRTGLSG